MIPFIKINLLTGEYRLIGKTNRAHLWKIKVVGTKGNETATYDFKLKQKMTLAAVRTQLSDLVWEEIKDLKDENFETIFCEVGI